MHQSPETETTKWNSVIIGGFLTVHARHSATATTATLSSFSLAVQPFKYFPVNLLVIFNLSKKGLRLCNKEPGQSHAFILDMAFFNIIYIMPGC